jgi:hypothetical protein
LVSGLWQFSPDLGHCRQITVRLPLISRDEAGALGADYVIVPEMSRDDNPAAPQWIKARAARGAIVICICAGALSV